MNRTPVFRTTGGDTVDYTNEELLAKKLARGLLRQTYIPSVQNSGVKLHRIHRT